MVSSNHYAWHTVRDICDNVFHSVTEIDWC